MRTDRFQEERRAKILTLLQERDRMSVDELSRHFKVTGATIRSDLTALMEQGKLIRTLGSAVLVPQVPMSPLAERLRIQTSQKRDIGRAAAQLVKAGDIIALDASSTSLAMAAFLKPIEQLTLVTNCLAVVGEFINHKNIRIIVPGGHLQHDSSSLVGPETLGFLKGLRVQTSFIGARSLGLDTGLCDSDPATMEFKKALIQVSKKVVAVVDSSKWEAISLTTFAKFDEIDTLVTDSGISKKNADALHSKGLTVVTA